MKTCLFTTILFVLLLSVYAGAEDEIKQFSDPALFWQETIAGNITKIVGQQGSAIIFEYNDSGKTAKGQVDKNLIEDNGAKTKGSIGAMNILITKLEQQTKDQAAYTKTIRRLASLTGQNIESPSEWRKWYAENKGSLIWSDQKNRLVLESGTN